MPPTLPLQVIALGLLLGVCAPSLAETPEQVQQRLELYRQQDEAAAQRKAEQAAAEARRREQTRQWQEQRRREEYARRWKCYGAEEIDVLLWRQQTDNTWVTTMKRATGAVFCARDKASEEDPPSRSVSQSSVDGDLRWVKIRASVSIDELAAVLSQSPSLLARLNGVTVNHYFQSGEWAVFPAKSSRLAKQLAALDTSEMRRTPPLDSPPPPQEPARVRFGDSLAKIAERYNVTIKDLLSLNPGLEAARLVVGTQIQVARSTPGRSRLILGLAPSGSGGLSWPDQASVGNSPISSYRGISPDSLIGVNCSSLMVNRKPAYENWGSWARPDKGSTDEQLVIDRCTVATN